MQPRSSTRDGRRIAGAVAIALAAALATTSIPTLARADDPIARATITPSARVADLVAQLTLDEKLTFVTPQTDPTNPAPPTGGSAGYTSIHRLTLCVCLCLWIPSGIDVTRVCGHA